MIEFWNVVVGCLCSFIVGMIVHSAYRHSFDGKPRGRVRRNIRGLLDLILDLETRIFAEGIPKHWIRVDSTFIAERLIEAFPFAKKIYLSDRYSYVCPKKEIEDFLAQDPTDKEKYLIEIFDCDDFAFRLMGQLHRMPYSALAFGIAWSGVHAYNVIVMDDGGNVWIVEPQSDKLISPKEAGKEYETELIWM